MLTKSQILEEYGKCLMDPIYAIENYLKTFDSLKGYVPFKLFPKQKEVIYNYENHRFNLVTKPRQAGITTLTAAYIAIKIAFADSDSPERALILANKEETAVSMLSKVKEFLDQLPQWVWGDNGSYLKKNKEKNVVLKNGSEVKALATSPDAARGFTPTLLIMDEAAFIENGQEVYGGTISTISTGGKATLISTPNGRDMLYYMTYKGAKDGDNGFKVTELKWYEDPRYNKDLRWITPEGEEIEEKEFTFESFREKEKLGYKPTSTWYEDMCSSLNQDERMIAQELDVNFLGSGGNVIEEKYIEYHRNTHSMDPKWIERTDKGGEVWIWEEPQEEHRYILSADPSRGDSDDSSVFTIIDFTTMEQVAEYKGKLYPDQFADVIDKYGRHYNAYVVVDITGGMGVATIRKLEEAKYPHLHYDNPKTKALNSESNKRKFNSPKERKNKIPGFSANSVRTTMIANLEDYVRKDGIAIRSERVLKEMETFVFINGRPDHMKGFHDDCLKEGTLIKTIDGHKPIEDIKVGELVLTHTGNYKSVEKVLEKPFSGEWYDFSFNGQLDLGLSYNHPLYAAPNTNKRDSESKRKERDWVFPNEWGKTKKNDKYYTDTQHYPRQVSIKEELRENENKILYEKDFYENPREAGDINLRQIKLDQDFAKFLGLFLADGHCKNKKSPSNENHPYSIQMAFNINDENLLKGIKDYLDKLNITSRTNYKYETNVIALNFSSKLLWYILSECYDKNREKILPYYSRYLGKDLKYTLEYWLIGDGWVDNRGHYDKIGATTSKQLALSMRDIAWSIGEYAVIRKNKRKRYDIINKDQYWVHIRSDHRPQDRLKPISSFEYGTKTVNVNKTTYNGTVYNLQVADDRSFIANGIVVHNCIMSLGMALWVLEDSFKKLEKLKDQNKAILDTWISANQNSGDQNNNNNENAFGYKTGAPIPKNNASNPKEVDYMWLFK